MAKETVKKRGLRPFENRHRNCRSSFGKHSSAFREPYCLQL